MRQLEHTNGYFDQFLLTIARNRRESIKYLAIFLPFILSLGALCLIGNETGFNVWLKVLQLLGFAVTGLFFWKHLKKKKMLNHLHVAATEVVYTVSMATMICVVLIFFYLLTHKSLILMSIASSAAFSFPYLVRHAWEIYSSIPSKQYAIWTKPTGRAEIDEIFLPVSLTVRFSLTKRYFGTREEFFPKNAMGHIKLGNSFYNMVTEENTQQKDTIEFLDDKSSPYAWEFYVSLFKGYYLKRLDPEQSMLENGLQDNSTVIAKRVRL